MTAPIERSSHRAIEPIDTNHKIGFWRMQVGLAVHALALLPELVVRAPKHLPITDIELMPGGDPVEDYEPIYYSHDNELNIASGTTVKAKIGNISFLIKDFRRRSADHKKNPRAEVRYGGEIRVQGQDTRMEGAEIVYVDPRTPRGTIRPQDIKLQYYEE